MSNTTQTPVRILFIGNSFTARNDLPALLTALAAAARPPVMLETEAILANGARLRQHWNKGTAPEAIRQGAWNYVVLQEQSTLPIKNPQRFHEDVRLFDTIIKEAGARTILYLTWARLHEPQNQEKLTDATKQIAAELGALMVPVGTAWQEALRQTPSPGLHDKDGSHPSLAGSRLAARVFYETLFGPNGHNGKAG